MRFFAHAGETHNTETEAAVHNLFTDWYVQLPLFILALAAVTWVIYKLTKESLSKTAQILSVILFVAGITTYSLTPMVSVLSLALGFGLALMNVLISLKAKPSN